MDLLLRSTLPQPPLSPIKLSPEPGLSFYSLWAAPWPLAFLQSQMPLKAEGTPSPKSLPGGREREGFGGLGGDGILKFSPSSISLPEPPKFFLTAVSAASFAPGLLDV